MTQKTYEPQPEKAGYVAAALDAFTDTIKTAAGNGGMAEYAKAGNYLSALSIIDAAVVKKDAAETAKQVALAAGGIVVGAGAAVIVGAISIPTLGALAGAAAGVVGAQILEGAIDKINDNPQWLEPLFPDPSDPENGEIPSRDYRIEYYDPLILDLNGDDIIGTISANGFTGALFDNDNDGIRTASGWISREDGLLVRDINDDGIINSGAELFGDSTLLEDGTKASNGFAALADLDSNGDGKVDVSDANFNQLKVWKDLNADGVTDANELFTLEDVGIKSLNTSVDEIINEKVAGGVLAESGTFTRLDGSSGKMADVNFENNDVFSKFTSEVTVSADVKSLPNLKGFGRLKDLHHAVMESELLKALLIQYAQLDSRTDQKELLDQLLSEWVKSDPKYTDNPIEIFEVSNINWYQSKTSENVIYLRPGDPLPSYVVQVPPPPEYADRETAAKVKFVDAVLGLEPTTRLNQYSADQIESVNQIYDTFKENVYKAFLNQTILKSYLESIDLYIGLNSDEIILGFDNLELMLQSNYSQNPLKALEDLKEILLIHGPVLQVSGWEKGYALLVTWRDELSQNESLKESVDKIFADVDIKISQGNDQSEFQILTNTSNIQYHALGGDDVIIISNSRGYEVHGGGGDDLIVSGKGSDYLNGGEGNNSYVFFNGAGKDFVNYENRSTGTDQLIFTDIGFNQVKFYQSNLNLIASYGDNNSVTLLGALDSSSTKNIIFRFNDSVKTLLQILEMPLLNLSDNNDGSFISGWHGADLLTGTNGDNQIFGYDGDDFLTGGKGNDRLHGGEGEDIYHFNSGDGIDEIYEPDLSAEKNTIVFHNILSTDIGKISFDGNDLVIQYGTTDKVKLKNYIEYSQNSAVEINFADQSVWTNNDLMSRVTFEGSEGNDTINATLINRTNIINAHGGDDIIFGNIIAGNTINGGAGNDQIHGGNSIDNIHGGTGDDFIFGQGGNDIINAGEGDDTIFGGEGDDYIVGGDGNDWLQGDDGADILIGGLGNDSYDVDELDTIIENPNEGYDSIFIESSFDLAGTNLEEIRLKGTGDFSAIGDKNDNALYGNDGNNFLDGKGGADIMSGGAGDDYYVVDSYAKLIQHEDGSTSLIRGDEVIEGLSNPVGYIFGDSGGIDTVEQWDDHRFYSLDHNANWYNTGSYHNLQANVENLILKGQAKVGFGNDLDNIIVGNDQDNYIDGLRGNDIYVYAQGGGTDTFSFEDVSIATNDLYIQGHEASEVYGQAFGDSVLLGFRNSTDKIWLSNYMVEDYYDDEGNLVTYKFDNIVFESGNTWTTTNVDALVERALNNQTPEVQYYPSNLTVKIDETLQYQFGDIIVDPDQDDQLSFTLTLQTQDSDGNYDKVPDWVLFDPETLTILANPQEGVDVGELNLYLWGTDLYGVSRGVGVTLNIQPSASTPIPGAIYDTLGNDVLTGGEEDNIFFYTGGKDILNESGGYDILRFSNGITFNQVGSGLTLSGNDLVLKVNKSDTNQITLKNFFLGGQYLVEVIEFETGGAMSAEQIFGLFGKTLPSNPLPELPPESPEPPDTNVSGNTTYNYSSGHLVITEQSGVDKVVFKNGITFNQVGSGLTLSGNDLILKVNRSDINKVTIKNFFLGGQYLVESFEFETGGVLTAEQIFGAFGMPMPQARSLKSSEMLTDLSEQALDFNDSSDALLVNNDLSLSDLALAEAKTLGWTTNYQNLFDSNNPESVNNENLNEIVVLEGFKDVLDLAAIIDVKNQNEESKAFEEQVNSIDLASILNEDLKSSQIDSFIQNNYVDDFIGQSLSISADSSSNIDMHVLTSQSQHLILQDFLNNQNVLY